VDQKIKALEEELIKSRADSEGPIWLGRREELPFRPGDKVRVYERISEAEEGGKERIQVFEGVVLQVRGRGTSRTFTVRKESFGIGVEKIFPISSPKIVKVEVVEPRGRVRRAKLFYLRHRRLR